MRHIAIITLILVFAGGTVAGIFIYRQTRQQQDMAAVTRVEIPSDDVSLVIPQIDGLRGVVKPVTPELGGTFSVTDQKGRQYTLSIPPGALSTSTEIELVPFLPDNDQQTLDHGVIIAPHNTLFQKPVLLTVTLSQTDPVLSEKTDTPVVYRFSNTNRQLVPQYNVGTTETTISSAVISSGAYLVSLNSSRAESIARVTLSSPTSTVLPVLQSAKYLTSSDRQLSTAEKDVATKAATATQNTLETDISSAQTASSALESTTSEVPSQQYINDVVANSEASAFQASYALHLLQQLPPEQQVATVASQLQNQLRDHAANKTVYPPSLQEFSTTYRGLGPVSGYDWAILGIQMIGAVYNVETVDSEVLQKLSTRIEPELNKDITVGQAYCSAFQVKKAQNEVCSSFDSKISVANGRLWQAGRDVTIPDGPYGRVVIPISQTPSQ